MALKNINAENREKLALKREGHLLIDKIKWRGYSKDTVYMMLAKEMGVEERHAHFSVMNSLRELRKAIEALRLLEKKTPKTEAASVDWNETVPIKSIKIIRYKAEKVIKIKQPQPPPDPSKKAVKNATRKANTLPQSAYRETLREIAEANRRGLLVPHARNKVPLELSTPSITNIELIPVPKKSWLYRLFKRHE